MYKVSFSSLLLSVFLQATLATYGQTVKSFEGIDASQLNRQILDFDPNGAVGTKQYMEWTNVAYQAFDKVTFAPIWPQPQLGTQPWHNHQMTNCYNVSGDGIITFDRLASRWVIAVRSANNGIYYYCFAISNTDDLSSSTLAWYTYQFYLNPVLGTNSIGDAYFPDWPKLGTWLDAYYASFDLLDPDNHYQVIGVVVCAFDRSRMLSGSLTRTPQCFSNPTPIPRNGSFYPSHSLIPADVDSTTAPPAGRHEYFVSIQDPPADGVSRTSNSINVWDLSLDWNTPSSSTFTMSSLVVPTFTPGCYNLVHVSQSVCVPEPSLQPNGTHYHVDAVGERLMPRFAYRNFGSYESFLISHTILAGITGSNQTAIRWYELRGSGLPTLFQTGTISPTKGLFRFLPSIAQDNVGNAAVGYSISGNSTHPGIKASWLPLNGNAIPSEISLWSGSGDEENSHQWGDYQSMTVDPVDGCTFWNANEYFLVNQTGTAVNWHTRISTFRIATCQ